MVSRGLRGRENKGSTVFELKGQGILAASFHSDMSHSLSQPLNQMMYLAVQMLYRTCKLVCGAQPSGLCSCACKLRLERHHDETAHVHGWPCRVRICARISHHLLRAIVRKTYSRMTRALVRGQENVHVHAQTCTFTHLRWDLQPSAAGCCQDNLQQDGAHARQGSGESPCACTDMYIYASALRFPTICCWLLSGHPTAE